MEGVTVTNIMADGSICDDLTGYFDTHEMPPEVKAIIRQMVLGSEKRRAELNESLKGAPMTNKLTPAKPKRKRKEPQ